MNKGQEPKSVFLSLHLSSAAATESAFAVQRRNAADREYCSKAHVVAKERKRAVVIRESRLCGD
jgi:hypothetical protein